MSDLKQEHDAAMAQLTAAGAPFELAGSETEGFHYARAPRTLAKALDAGRAHGDREFLVYEGERRSYSDLFAEADALAAALQAQGVGKGDRVAIAMRNFPEWMAAFIAIPAIGAVIVPINSWGQPADVAYALSDSGARFVFCDQQRYDGVADLLSEQGIQAVIARPANVDDPMGLPNFVADFAGATVQPVDIDGEDLTLIMYTSGTSGKPKGAASSNRAICQALYNMECNAMAAAMTNGETIGAMLEKGYEPTSLLAVPLFHVSGCHAQFLANLRGGRRIVMMYKWDVDKALDYVEQERVTTIAAAPSMILDLLESPRFGEADTDSLFSLGIGGAATPPKVGKLLARKLPQNFSGTGYGMTETNAQGASFTGKAWGAKPGSSGYPHPIAQFRICDEHGDELAQGETGEIWIRSCTNVREYWNRPEANAQEFRDGWFKTGDVGYFDEDGFIYLADRAKDMIIRGGENIYPIEIENQLIEHEAVKEVAVIGLPDERMGEEVCAVIHLHGTLSEEELLAFAKDNLASFKVPSRVIFTDQPLPRNAANKVLKPLLRKGILEELGLAD
ncbi:MAG: acyl--CoA ligase [Halioglobus sp.]|nr:acyl--CoA ligase [Halioglobus sp.]